MVPIAARTGIGQDMGAMTTHDAAVARSCIGREAGVIIRADSGGSLCLHLVSNAEFGRPYAVATSWVATCQHIIDASGDEAIWVWSDRFGRCWSAQITVMDQPLCDQQIDKGCHPKFKIGQWSGATCSDRFPGMAGFVEGPLTECSRRDGDRQHPCMPCCLECGGLPATRDRLSDMAAADIMRAIQHGSAGERGCPVPIMLSRVTRLASSPSVHPSVPGGRIGTTR